MSEHTIHNPEKLEFKTSACDPNRYLIVIDDGSKWLMSIQHNEEQVEARQIANMRRLVASWNACQGVDTDTLEEHPARIAPEGEKK